MVWRDPRRILSNLCVVLILALALAGALPIGSSAAEKDDIETLAKEVARYSWPARAADKSSDELIALGARYVEAAKRQYGPRSHELAAALNSLAQFHYRAGHYEEADAFFRQELAVREDPDVLADPARLKDIAYGFYRRGNSFAAYPYDLGAADAAAARFGAASLQYADALDHLVVWHSGLRSLEQAERFARTAIQITETTGGPEHKDLLRRLHNLITVLKARHGVGITDDIEAQYLRLLSLWEKLGAAGKLDAQELGNGHAYYIGLLACYKDMILYFDGGTERIKDVIAIQRRALLAREKASGSDGDLLPDLVLLAGMLRETGDTAEAEQQLRRALAIADARSIVDVYWQQAVRDLSAILVRSGRGQEATTLYRHALERTKDARELRTVLLSELAHLQARLGRRRDAELSYIRALLNTRPVSGEYWQSERRSSLRVGLAELYADEGRLAEAESLFIQARLFDPGYQRSGVGSPADRLASLHADAGRWITARYYLRMVKPPLFSERTETSLARSDRFLTGKEPRTPDRRSLALSTEDRILNIVRASYHAPGGADRELASALATVQDDELATPASRAVQQMAVRFAKGTGEDARLVRARQDALAKLDDLNRPITGLFPLDEAKGRKERDQSARAQAELASIDASLKERFPTLQMLLAPQPVGLAEIRSFLSPDEAFIVTADVPKAGTLPEETFVWVITKTQARWIRSNLGTKALTELVAALRCGLDHTLWDSALLSDSAKRCRATLGAVPGVEKVKVAGKDREVQVLPFDIARAHALYKALLGPVEDLIKDNHLLIVPSGPLTSLPFNVLVTEPPTGTAVNATRKLSDYRATAWLGTRQPITVLPSIASLKALRQFAKTSHATKPYLGVGNPLLDGQQDDALFGAYYKKLAQAARDKQQCPMTPGRRLARADRRSVTSFASLFRDANADIEELRQFAPLPETADELCEVGRSLGVPESEILLGGRATETTLKNLSETGKLGDYAILHFATHGALTGQVQGSAEPGLILTPPAKGTSDPQALERDDGFLTASEIATLKLDADWVILSACNTAGGNGETAEALSGLARAFFYAGARALLVSHWEVGSAAAVKLTTQAFARLKANPKIGRADAFRLSMRELIEKGSLAQAHPSQWAPFVVVGEGAAAR